MSLVRTLLALLLLLAPLDSVLAQHKHDHKPKHGGVIKETGGFVYELKVAPKEITVWVTDESNKPVPTSGSTAKVTLIPDATLRAEVPLEPAGDNRFHATGDFAIKPGSSALLDVSVGGKSIAKLRYVLK
jgi:hypothetical protein